MHRLASLAAAGVAGSRRRCGVVAGRVRGFAVAPAVSMRARAGAAGRGQAVASSKGRPSLLLTAARARGVFTSFPSRAVAARSFTAGAADFGADDNEDDYEVYFDEGDHADEDDTPDDDPLAYFAEDELQQEYHERIVQLLEEDDFASATRVYEEMQADCVKPLPETRVELIFYSPVISEALDVLHDMSRSGDQPSVVVYNEILRRCAECKLEYTALRLLREMERFGIDPDVSTYCLVIRTIGRARWTNYQAAYDFAMEIVHRKNMYVPERMWLELLKACKVPASLPLVRKIMDTLFDSGAQPSTAIFNAAMGVASRSDAVTYAFELYDRMHELGIRPSSSTYSLLIQAIDENSRLNKDHGYQMRALELFRTMLANEIAPSLTAIEAVERIAKVHGDEETLALAKESREIVEGLLEEHAEMW